MKIVNVFAALGASTVLVFSSCASSEKMTPGGLNQTKVLVPNELIKKDYKNEIVVYEALEPLTKTPDIITVGPNTVSTSGYYQKKDPTTGKMSEPVGFIAVGEIAKTPTGSVVYVPGASRIEFFRITQDRMGYNRIYDVGDSVVNESGKGFTSADLYVIPPNGMAECYTCRLDASSGITYDCVKKAPANKSDIRARFINYCQTILGKLVQSQQALFQPAADETGKNLIAPRDPRFERELFINSKHVLEQKGVDVSGIKGP